MPRVRAREANPLHARYGMDRFQQPSKITILIVWRLVVIHNLPEQLHLPMAGFGSGSNFGQDFGLGPHALLAPGVRHDAETAVLVAALDDRDPRAHRVAPSRHPERKRHIVSGAEVNLDLPGLGGLLDQQWQHPDAARSDDHVDETGALQERGTLLLRHAPRDRHDRFVAGLPAQRTELAEPRIQLVFGPLPDAAGVDDDDVGVAVLGRALITSRLEQPRHLLGIVIVHLAAEGLDQVFPAHFRPFAFRLSLSPFAWTSLSPRAWWKRSCLC